MAKEKKEFRAGTYAVLAGIVVAVLLVVMTIFAYTTRYTAFSPEKVAKSYTDNIVQTGDGYNAYKNTLVSENGKLKYGDFIRRAYMICYVNDGEDVKQADFVGTGSDEEQAAIDKVYNTMYDYYVSLLSTYGWDDYDAIFSHYFEKLVSVRAEVYGDEYMDMDYMFGAFESNVQTYADSLTGTEEELAADKKTVLREKTTGAYQTMFGEDYKLTATVKECKEFSADETKTYVEAYKERITPVAESGAEKAKQFGLDEENTGNMVGAFEGLDHADEIDSVAEATVEVTDQNGTVVATQTVYMVKIGRSWYVDNTNVNTSGLYLAK